MTDRSKILCAMAILCVLGAAAGKAGAFHEQGTANCSGCHTMHNSLDGIPESPFSHPGLLRFESATDLCLSCHAVENGAVFGPDPLNPPPEKGAGNFTFLLENNINDGNNGIQNPIEGHHAGHNVSTSTWGIPIDPANNVAPGGSYPADQLGCTSCHDAHGNQNFRMLRDTQTGSRDGFVFIYPAPIALGINIQQGQESLTNHTAYQSGWADWCANCHGYYHENIGQGHGFDHPAAEFMSGEEYMSYNEYSGPSDPSGGDYMVAYIPEVPFEDEDVTISSSIGASASSRVMCLSCHRAHATSAPMNTRWDPNIEFLDEDGQVSSSYPIPSPYPEPGQRALCVKCHYRGLESHGLNQPCMRCHRSGGP
ncbi:MAG: hypothetical protein KJ831_03870 [Candidatus Eisenbacteria bacterium]|nr:hypothetical protein [Candidatus Eisenbacteria bacterium]